MKTIAVLTSIAMLASAPAFAWTSNSNSNSQSNAGSVAAINLDLGDTNIRNNTPSLGAGANNNTTTCAIGVGGGIVVPGFGMNFGDGKIDNECNVREEMAALNALLGNKAALKHACFHDESMRRTLVDMGVCQLRNGTPMYSSVGKNAVEKREPSVEQTSASEQTAYRSCSFDNKTNKLRVQVRSGYSKQEAIEQCKTHKGF